MNIPSDWTDDVSVNLKQGKSYEELTFILMDSIRNKGKLEAVLLICTDEFGLSNEEGELAIDRVQGGIIRAISCNPKNKPDKVKDPMAWYSFNKVWKSLPKRHWWSSKRDNKGEWLDWYNETRKNS
jgi:hypothetical protein